VTTDTPTLQIVIVSTRPGRKGPAVGAWFEDLARRHGTFRIEVADLGTINLPMMDEPEHPRLRKYQHDHTKAWSTRIDRADAFVFVTPEYNYGTPPSLVNALDYLVEEWAYKPVGFLSYGGASGGLRSVQMTKSIVSALKMVPLVEAVAVPFFTKFIDASTGVFTPDEVHAKSAARMLDELLRWSSALRVLRPGVV
jgi:NAD(P)H-dependent FMN reductase